MKFVYEQKEQHKIPVAMIDYDGDLVFRCESMDNAQGMVAVNPSTNKGYFATSYDFNEMLATAQRVFYKGDELTIKF